MLSDQQRDELRRRIALAERQVRSRRRRRRLRRAVSIILLILVLILLADAAAAIYSGRAGLTLSENSLASVTAQSLLSQPTTLAQLQLHLALAHTDLQRADFALTPWAPLLTQLGRLPTYGAEVASVAPLLRSATCLVGAAATTTRVAQTLVAQGNSAAAATGDVRTEIKALAQEQPAISAAQQDLTCAETGRKAVDPRLNTSPGRLGPALAQLDSGLIQADNIISTLAMLPSAANALLGVDTPRQYLVLGQDPFELRATGGFIGGMGLIKVANGAITSFDYRGVLDFEPPNQTRLDPPTPLVKYMGLGGWYLRDANWSPDFPTSARQVEAFFKMDQGVQADGVIALDLYAVQDLLAAIGPVYIPAYKETVTADTLLPQLWDQINASGSVAQAREQDKTDYLNALVAALLQRLKQPDAVAVPKLLAAILQAAQERHLQVYAADPNVEALVTRVHADGAVWNGPGDGLEVVDTQVSYAKMAAVVDESLGLDVTLGADGQVTSDVLTVTYVNNYATLGAQRVWRELHSELFDFHTDTFVSGTGIMATYVRVLTPPGSTLNGVQGGDDLPGFAVADGHSEISSYLVVRPRQSRSLQFSYVPHITGIAANSYQLMVQKQPGTVADALVVRLHVPPSLAVTLAQPGWTLVAPNIWQYRGDLRQDRHLAFQWRLP